MSKICLLFTWKIRDREKSLMVKKKKSTTIHELLVSTTYLVSALKNYIKTGFYDFKRKTL